MTQASSTYSLVDSVKRVFAHGQRRTILATMGAATVTVAGSLFGLQASAAAGNACGADASAPEFSETQITGDYQAVCGSNPKADYMYGKVKEDRNLQPDATHDTEYFFYDGSDGSTVATDTCQNGDDIYIEASNDDGNEQGPRRNMSC